MRKQSTRPDVEQVYYILNKIMTIPNKGYITYAKSYAHAAIYMQMRGRDLEIQVLYVLNNLAQWTGEEARESKKMLKAFAGVK